MIYRRIVSMMLSFLLMVTLSVPSLANTEDASSENETIQILESGKTDVSIGVSFEQSDARSMLSLINEFRTGEDAWIFNSTGHKTTVTGLSELCYDYTLESIAMMRAAELAICYDHTRPDGTNCFTAFPAGSSYTKKGENVAAGIRSAEQTFSVWKEDGASSYSEQAHRRAMLSGEYNAIGISHVRFNGLDFWVQVLGYSSEPNTSETEARNGEAMVAITVLNQNVTVSEIRLPTQVTMKQGESQVSPVADVLMTMENTWPEMSFDAKVYPDWNSEATGIVSVDGDHLTAHETGKTTLNAVVFGEKESIPVRVVDQNTIPVRGISIVSENTTVQENKILGLKVIFEPADNTEQLTVAWTSSNLAVASVSENGVVTGKTIGTAVIRATCEHYQAEIKIKVVEDPDAQCPSNRFGDLDKTLWYHEGVDYMLRNGYMAGTGQFSFEPNGMVTRGQVVTILYAMSGKPYVLRTKYFKDVPSGEWYSGPVHWAATNGLVAGYGDGNFGPDDNVTREQMVAILYQYTKFKGYKLTMQSTDLEDFPDCTSISSYAMIPMLWAVSNGIVSGTDRGLEPTAPASRAQVAVMMKSYNEKIAGK